VRIIQISGSWHSADPIRYLGSLQAYPRAHNIEPISSVKLDQADASEADLWDEQIETIDDGRVRRVRVLCHGKPASYAETIEGWQFDSAFRAFFIGVLADAPYRAYLWETPPITRHSSGRAFEFVLVDSPQLAGSVPDPVAFQSHFGTADSGAGVAVFPNLGGDAILVAPTPQAPLMAYPHLAAFVRSAPAEQQHEFWQSVGSTFADRLSARPLWLSTNGLGVAWLHARLDTRPKYYTFGPYRKSN